MTIAKLLPTEILCGIFSQLTYRDLKNVSAVCQVFRRIMQEHGDRIAEASYRLHVTACPLFSARKGEWKRLYAVSYNAIFSRSNRIGPAQFPALDIDSYERKDRMAQLLMLQYSHQRTPMPLLSRLAECGFEIPFYSTLTKVMQAYISTPFAEHGLKFFKKEIYQKSGKTLSLPYFICKFGWLDALEIILPQGIQLNPSKGERVQDLQVACRYSQVHIVKKMMELGYGGKDQNRKRIKHLTDCLYIDKESHRTIEMLTMLLEAGALVNSTNGRGITPLYYAAANGSLQSVIFFIRNGADINSKAADEWNLSIAQGTTPLMIAAQNGEKDVVSELLNAGASTMERDRDGHTALDEAVKSQNMAIVQMLLEKGAQVWSKTHQTSYSIKTAIRNGHLSLLNILFDSINDPNIKNACWKLAFKEACQYQQNHICQFLISAIDGIDTGVIQNDIPEIFINAASHGNVYILDFLINRFDVDIDVRTRVEGPPLYEAVLNKQIDAVRYLLKSGADPDLRSKSDDQSPLEHAVLNGYVDIIDTLMEFQTKADINLEHFNKIAIFLQQERARETNPDLRNYFNRRLKILRQLDKYSDRTGENTKRKKQRRK